MLAGTYVGVYADSNRLMPALPALSPMLRQPVWQVVKVYESKVCEPVMAPGKAFAVPQALMTPLRLILLTWAPVAVVMPGIAGGVVPKVLVMVIKSTGTEKFRALCEPAP